MNRTLISLPVLALACSLGCGDDPAGPGADAGPDVDAPATVGPGLAIFEPFIAVDITPDGATAVLQGIDDATAIATVSLVDTATGVVTRQIAVGDPSHDLATGVAATGRLSAMHGVPVQAGVWDVAGGWRDLGSPHATGCDDLAAAWDVSADGAVVVGMAWNGCRPDAFRWTEATGFTTLQVVGVADSGTPTNRATVVSDDGRISAGFAQRDPLDRSAAAWRADGTGFLLQPDNVEVPSEVLSISADGATLAGVIGDDGFRWTEAGGFELLARLESSLPGDRIYPNAMSADGALIFGGVGDAFFTTPVAFVWSAAAGMRSLADVAATGGVTVPAGVLLNSVLGASADAGVLVGVATDAEGATRTFVLRLPRSAYGS